MMSWSGQIKAAGNLEHEEHSDLHAEGKKRCECARSMWRPITALVVAASLSAATRHKIKLGWFLFQNIVWNPLLWTEPEREIIEVILITWLCSSAVMTHQDYRCISILTQWSVISLVVCTAALWVTGEHDMVGRRRKVWGWRRGEEEVWHT